MVLRFSDVLADMLNVISHELVVPVDTLWDMCKLHLNPTFLPYFGH